MDPTFYLWLAENKKVKIKMCKRECTSGFITANSLSDMIAQCQINNDANKTRYKGEFTKNSFQGIQPPLESPMSGN